MSALGSAEFEVAHHEGQKHWSPIVLPLADFAASCAIAQVPPEALRLRPDDLYLAYAAGLHAAGAAEALDRRFLGSLVPNLRRVGTRPDAVCDVLQTIRERLLTGTPPRLLAYNGTAPLRSWIKVIAVRLAIDLVRAGSTASRADSTFAAQPSETAADPATLLAKAEYRGRLELALRDEFARLPPDRRAILRLHFIDNQSVEAIAQRLGVHRVTVARWLWSTGEQILENLRRRFWHEFSVVAPDFDSLVRLARSNMRLDLRDLLD